jgi:hypothetical protein
MEDIEVAFFVLMIGAWFFGRMIILKYKPIPKWLDVAIAIVIVIGTIYVTYDTFLK